MLSLRPGSRVDQYEIKRPLGEGGMGIVYLARDTILGRSVALKLVRPERLGAAGVRAFLVEARTTARFSHPNIVVLYAVGEHDGCPYIALEYLEGLTLRERADARPLSAREAQRVMLDVARGVAEAHRHGVLHRDLKPANVIVTPDGRVRVLDFGLAGELGEPGNGAGTPAYMAPEQWRREPPTPAVDVWAIGVMLYELVAGHRPFDAASAVLDPAHAFEPLPEGAPAELAGLVSQCLERNPGHRVPMQELVHRLERLVAGAAIPAIDESPFRGLEAFAEHHAAFFHGRGDDIAALVERIRGETVVAVVGPSGAGKSSLVQAGVVPRLREQGPWLVLGVRPGSAPFRALAAQLLYSGPSTDRPDGSDIETLAAALDQTPGMLNVRLHELAQQRRAQVLLFVDQLEEVYTHVDDPAVRTRFAAALVSGAGMPEDPVRVVFTLRDDFLGRLAEAPSMQRTLGRVTVLRAPRREALRECLLEPVRLSGHTWDDPTLVETMLDAVEGAPANLPLLQFACSALWARRDAQRRLLRRGDYVDIGGVAGALAEHAEMTIVTLSAEQRNAARTILMRLVTPEGTRRVLSRAQALEGTGPLGDGILVRLQAARLLTARSNTQRGAGDPLFELAHESLIRSWRQLAAWLDESHEERVLIAELTEAHALWQRRGRSNVDLLAATVVGEARRRLKALSVDPEVPLQDFLARSEEHGRLLVRKRRVALTATFTALVAVSVASLVAAARFKEQAQQINLAAADIGHFELVLLPFDGHPDTGKVTPVPPDDLPRLAWALHRVNPDDDLAIGELIPPEQLRRKPMPPAADGPPALAEEVEARSGPAILVISGRGQGATDCAPSVLRLRSLPGYAEREQAPTRIEIRFPTCSATASGMVIIPAGEFIHGGVGVPPTSFREYVDAPETRESLPTFSIARTETTNAAYALFARLGEVTGTRMPVYPKSAPYDRIGDPDRPVTQIEYRAAHDYCAFLGGRLPTTLEWEKAARGGLFLAAGEPNPEPRRNVPWVGPAVPAPANLDGEADGFAETAPVGRFPVGASPYGVLDLAGNVDEWTSSRPEGESGGDQRIVRGGGWTTPPAQEMHTLAYENTRVERHFDFSLGFRCVKD